MYSLRSVEEHMRNVNEKKNFNCVENVTNVFWTHFTERLGRVHGVYIFKTTKSQWKVRRNVFKKR